MSLGEEGERERREVGRKGGRKEEGREEGREKGRREGGREGGRRRRRRSDSVCSDCYHSSPSSVQVYHICGTGSCDP